MPKKAVQESFSMLRDRHIFPAGSEIITVGKDLNGRVISESIMRKSLVLEAGTVINERIIAALNDKQVGEVRVLREANGLSPEQAIATKRIMNAVDNRLGDLLLSARHDEILRSIALQFRSSVEAASGNSSAVPNSRVDRIMEIGMKALAKMRSESLTELIAMSSLLDAKIKFDHSIKTFSVSVSLGELLSIPEEELVELARSAMLHDVGFGFLPIEGILKNGTLTDRDRFFMSLHPLVGFQVLSSSQNSITGQSIVSGVHHESPDGLLGYGIRTNFNSFLKKDFQFCTLHQMISRIVIVVDKFVGLMSSRADRKAKTIAQTLMILARESYEGKIDRTVTNLIIKTFAKGGRPIFSTGEEIEIAPYIAKHISHKLGYNPFENDPGAKYFMRVTEVYQNRPFIINASIFKRYDIGLDRLEVGTSAVDAVLDLSQEFIA